MPFTTNPLAYANSTFMGAKVVGFSTAIGWGVGNPSQLTLQLVDDPAYGAEFDPAPVGTPAYFACGGLSFGGLFQKWEEKKSLQGNPVYEAIVQDPRSLLEAAQVIVAGYNGPVGSLPNLFNAFGYWEAQGYGASLSNPETGMPWYRVRDAVLAMANTPAPGAYGGPITFRGYTYSLDLSELPEPPPYYRVGGAINAGLMDLVAQVCEDGGCDFFVELVGFTIRVRTVSRFAQPPLGTVEAFAAANAGGSVVAAATGLECRTELTSAFLVGGDVSTLWTTDAIQSFWGYDFAGAPVVGVPISLPLFDAAGEEIGRVACEQMDLNAAPVADIVGTVRYPCTTLELRYAQHSSASWLAYINTQRPDVGRLIGLGTFGCFDEVGAAFAPAPVRPNFVDDRPDKVKQANSGDAQDRLDRLYEFVKGFADEFMGRKFLVGLPFILNKTDPETLRVTTTWEVTDGGYMPEGSSPLGVSALNQDTLTTQDGRFRAFVVFGNLAGADLGRVSPQGSFVENGLLYQECQVDPQILFLANPCVLVSLQGPVADREALPAGDLTAVAAAYGVPLANAQPVVDRTAAGVKAAPATRSPAAAAVPLKSNVLTYGPWYAAGAPGKVRVEYDPSLTPWACGGYGAMALLGAAKVTTAVTNMQVGETGAVEVAGLPQTSLGDVLQAGGPNITGMDVQFGPSGVATSYRFQTFTPRFGVFGHAYADRLKRIALTAAELRRGVRAALKGAVGDAQVLADATRAARAWRQNMPKALQKQTPQDVLHAYCVTDGDGNTRVHPGLTTMEEALALSNADTPSEFVRTAMMSLGGLVRPFGTGSGGTAQGMPKLTAPAFSGPTTADALNPWKAVNDVEVFAYGNDYSGAHAFRRGVAGTDARVFGLRGPLVLVGWGYDTDCQPVPGTGGNWDADYLTRSDKWKAGPMDPLWDERRGVWTVHGQVRGYLPADIPANSSGNLRVTSPDGAVTWEMTVWNDYQSTISGSRKAFAMYIPADNKWYVVSADCATS